MIPFIEHTILDRSRDERRLKRRGFSLFRQQTQFFSVRFRGAGGRGADTQDGSTQTTESSHNNTWTRIAVGDHTVDYDEQSHQFIVAPLHGGGTGESFYFKDLPLKIKKAINAQRHAHHMG